MDLKENTASYKHCGIKIESIIERTLENIHIFKN
jgi:hypothetical protein